MITSSTSRRRGAVALGVLSVLPLALFVVAVGGFAVGWVQTFNRALDLTEPGGASADGFGASGLALFAVAGIGGAALSMCLVAFYVVDASRTPAVPAERRATWIRVLLTGSALVF